MESDVNGTSEPTQASNREPITPAKRKRLQQIFSHASKQMAQENYDYATELFSQCVIGDPANLIYAQSYVGNLRRKYNNNRTGSKLAQFKERGARGALKKASGQGQWDDVIKHGLKVLTVNPWDVPALTSMATAAEESGDEECELFYLKCALEANSKDPDVNRQCAKALAARREYDQAIACWHRVEQARPGDVEAQRAIASLAVEKTIFRGGYDDDDEQRKLKSGRKDQPQQPVRRELTPEEKLEQRIAQNPKDMDAYHELAQLHFQNEDYKAAEELYERAYRASDEDPDIRERWEDAQLRRMRQQIALATDDETRKKLRSELIQKELVFYQNCCERYPNNLAFKYDLGLRYQLSGQYNEAIKQFQVARNDPRRKGLCMLSLGKCFEKIKQFKLATTHYDASIAEIPDRDTINRKDALYRAGRLAIALKDLDAAEKHLTRLAEMDFGYRDVSELLDKIATLRDNA
ncbi:MAG: tetratricopeptide repeat protein [Pirellulales bacterium]|nr:tetratricopeptide repeat protein [Pirellulales bacterium]